jgi:branched-chain amino acid transport system ATP-binding protein
MVTSPWNPPVFTLERGSVFHQGPAGPLLNDLAYRKQILWL